MASELGERVRGEFVGVHNPSLPNEALSRCNYAGLTRR
jgi:hypothetical protein